VVSLFFFWRLQIIENVVLKIHLQDNLVTLLCNWLVLNNALINQRKYRHVLHKGARLECGISCKTEADIIGI